MWEPRIRDLEDKAINAERRLLRVEMAWALVVLLLIMIMSDTVCGPESCVRANPDGFDPDRSRNRGLQWEKASPLPDERIAQEDGRYWVIDDRGRTELTCFMFEGTRFPQWVKWFRLTVEVPEPPEDRP